MKEDILYEKLAVAEKILTAVKHNSIWHYKTVKQMIYRDISRLKSLLDEVQLLLSEDATEGGDKDAK